MERLKKIFLKANKRNSCKNHKNELA